MAKISLANFHALQKEVEAFHGHLCAGISIGIRMTIAGLEAVGLSELEDPANRKKLLVFVEIDRCASDAIMALTGCRPGKRSMKVKDYGKMAATFINTETGKAVRLAAAPKKPGDDQSNWDFATIPTSMMFSIVEVEVPLAPTDMPGRSVAHAQCARCGETVLDGRDVTVDGQTLCQPCASGQDYYRIK